MPESYYWSPVERRYIDAVGAEGVGLFSALSRETLEGQFGPLELISESELDARILRDSEQGAVTLPVEISEERYEEMFRMLAPVRWVENICSTSSFRFAEPVVGTIYPTYIRVYNRFFEAMRPFRESHSDLVELVELTIPGASQAVQQLN